jgi:hypothetical protein
VLSAVLIAVAALIYLATLSSSYRQCDSDRQQGYSQYGEPNFFEKSGTLIVCEGATIDANGELLTALGTLAVASFTLTLWLATIEQGRLTRESIGLARKTAQRELRAYVNLREGGINRGRQIEITFKNFGQTPAYQLSFWADAIELWRDEFPDFRPPEGAQNSDPVVLAPTGEFLAMPSIRDIKNPNRHRMTAGRPVIYAFGEVTYIDAFNKPRETKFFVFNQEGFGPFRTIGPYNSAT